STQKWAKYCDPPSCLFEDVGLLSRQDCLDRLLNHLPEMYREAGGIESAIAHYRRDGGDGAIADLAGCMRRFGRERADRSPGAGMRRRPGRRGLAVNRSRRRIPEISPALR